MYMLDVHKLSMHMLYAWLDKDYKLPGMYLVNVNVNIYKEIKMNNLKKKRHPWN